MSETNIYSPPASDLSVSEEGLSSIEVEGFLASRWGRLGAYLIDTIILILPYAAIFVLTDDWEDTLNEGISINEQVLYFFAGLTQYLIFNGYLLHKRGQTIGKWVLGIKIVSVQTNEVISVWKVFLIRYVPFAFIAMLPFIGIFLAIVNDLFIFRKDKRCLHDHLAGTRVVKEYAH